MSYWRICLNGVIPCRKTYVMERNKEWRIYYKEGGHVSWVGIFFESYYYKVSTGIFCVCLGFVCVHAKSRIEVCIMECCTLHSRVFELQF